MSYKYTEIYNKMHYHQQEIDKLKQQILRDECDHMWIPEEGYLYSGFYCRKCGSTK